jgi:dihydrofolate reductase/thymidylate synthase
MSLIKFNIIVAVDINGGIAKDGKLPWTSQDDMRFFRDTTVGNKRNVVIMGRETYESLPPDFRPLPNRKCVVISRKWQPVEHPEVLIFPTISDALRGLGQTESLYDEVFITGGQGIYDEIAREWMYLCKKVYITHFRGNFNCDKFFPVDTVKSMCDVVTELKTRDFNRVVYTPKKEISAHGEYQYLDLLKRIRDEGESKKDRTKVGTRSLFAPGLMTFDISQRVPILTTKKVNYNAVIKELLFFISGRTNTNELRKDGVNIWNENTSRSFIESRGLKYPEGDMGPMYGYQWRHWNHPYTTTDSVPPIGEGGIDQLSRLIDGIRREPHGRRHILSAWNVEQLDEGVLAPCHCFVQFNVSGDGKYLDCLLTQRSGDMFLGVPFNIASYAFLTYMIAHVTSLLPRKLTVCVGDAHIYNNHIDQVNKQLNRTPYPQATLSFRQASLLTTIDHFTFDSFIIDGYQSWPALAGAMAV